MGVLFKCFSLNDHWVRAIEAGVLDQLDGVVPWCVSGHVNRVMCA